MEQSQMFRKHRQITCGMHQAFAHVITGSASGVRDDEDAPAGASVICHQSAAFLDRGKDENVTLLNDGAEILDKPEQLDAWVIEPLGQQLAVARRKVSGDQKSARGCSAGTVPGLQGVMESFAGLTSAH